MKLLVIRMSSLGDVILSTAFLEALPADVTVDWVVAKEFAFVLKGHPRIRNLIEFDKKTGFKGWFNLIHHLAHQEYDQRVDLHLNLRSQLARILFHWFDLSLGIWVPWKTISKQRFRFYGYLFFKRLWPRFLKPVPFSLRFARLAMKIGGQKSAKGRPSLVHLVKPASDVLSEYSIESKKYFVIMPSSRWRSKEWNVDSYFEACSGYAREKNLIPVVMGRLSDRNAVALLTRFTKNAVDHRSILTENDFSNTATLMKHAAFYVGSDTGLAHLAEAVGTPAFMIFGPTRPDLGFGPWRDDSASITADVWCSPCSKDGRICYRFRDRYACLKKIKPDQVKGALP